MASIQFNFPIQYLGNGDELKLTIKFVMNYLQNPPEVEFDAMEDEVYINDLGTIEHEYHLEDFFVSPPFYDLRLSFPETSEFAKILFSSSFPYSTSDKRAEVKLEIKYADSSNWEIEFLGHFVEEAIDYNPDTTIFMITCAPKTDTLNRKMVLKDSAALNPFSYPVPDSEQTYMCRMERLITDIYKLINPDVDVNIIHNWIFVGVWNRIYDVSGDFITFPFAAYEPPSSPQVKDDIAFADLYQDLRPLYFGNISNLGDMLRKLALDWGCMTGMLNANKAFFKNIFETNDVYNLSDDTYFQRSLKYQLPLLSYVEYKIPGGSPYELGNFTGLEGSFLSRESLVGFSNTFTNILTSLDHTYDVQGVKDNRLFSYFVPYGELITKFWYELRSNQEACRIDPVVTPGLRHSIIKNYSFQGHIYQPLRVKKFYKECYAEIDGMIVS